jgi:DNA (cytosine-5)-methyltransferase 1
MIACVDLFCGVGGLTHGLSRGGINVVAGIDVDDECRYPYESNNSARFINQDVAMLTAAQVRNLWPNGFHRLLAGCAPCQPFSTYTRKGRKNGAQDSKWALVATFGRLIQEVKPDLITMENVPQVADHAVFNDFVASMNGYHVWHRIIECADYGVPQTRKRLVLMASRFGPIDLPAIDGSARPTVRQAIAHLTPITAGQSDRSDRLHRACKLSKLNLRRIKASKPGGTWRDWDKSIVARCHRRRTGDTYPSVYGRMEWDRPAPTITTQCFGYGNGRFGHPEQNRAITLREAAILQSFPESYKFLNSGQEVRFSVLGRLIGNAVPVKIGEAVARAFLNHTIIRTPPPGSSRRSHLPHGRTPGGRPKSTLRKER